jgi:hypothetical protein
LTKRIDDVNVKIDNWSARVENLERRCEVCSYPALPFICLFSILTCFLSQSYDDSFARQELINIEADAFKRETTIAIEESRRDIDNLVTVMQELPGTIRIKSSQVHHHGSAEEDQISIDNSLTLDVIVNRQNEGTMDLEKRLDDHEERMDLMDEHVGDEIVRVMDWVTEQKQDEANEMSGLKDRVEKIEFELNGKMSYLEVDEKIAVKVRGVLY